MNRKASTEIKRGQAVSFRIPSDTPDHLLKHLQKLKETERRNFSSKIAEFVMAGVGQSFTRERESITIPLPHPLTKSQRDWLKHEHSEALLGSIVYQLITNPARTTSLLAALNSSSLDINEALYLQEESRTDEQGWDYRPDSSMYEQTWEPDSDLPKKKQAREIADFSLKKEVAVTSEEEYEDDDLDSFSWEEHQAAVIEEAMDESENDLDSLLGDFLAKMNK